MDIIKKLSAILIMTACSSGLAQEPGAVMDKDAGDLSSIKTIAVTRGLTESGKNCIGCHRDIDPGIVSDWKQSRHGHVGVSCIDCHAVPADSPMAVQHEDVFDMDDYDTSLLDRDVLVSALVPPSTCASCHAVEHEQFAASGHFRSYHQIVPKDNLHALVEVHEGRNIPELMTAPKETGCMQCHGTEIELDENGRPTPATWPNAGMGNVYPNESTGNCSACHTRHKFSLAEARKPFACASCHLGPDHPDIEIFENSKHGHVYNTQGDDWTWDTAPGAWEPGDYRAPTCATCHMSGIGDLLTTHNISERLYWNGWAKRSEMRNSTDPMSPLLGNGPAGREKMKQVCSSCHGTLHTDGFFEQADKAVRLYNVGYYDPASKMLDELGEKGLLKDNPWTDEFQIVFYHLWHHEGRRARQGALMGAPDYAHWHGFFELQQDLYKLEEIYAKRLETGKIE
ncbi:MAG TPA: multiheme c-type cytochrome [Woeseiaceae bacterium]|nr:multiheme c-type cytochrome [Woeseiaceae bacterium]